ncbi:MAG: sugar phosphate isomerase/epimerase [Candidatus Krumholzibacteriota bacterium]|nr:sugar phosphate isomerase/epimerase [Candidatus Krumholzibacteriota bacterium]
MRFYLSVPLDKLEEKIDFVRKEGFLPEVRMTNVDHMMSISSETLSRIRKTLSSFSFTPLTHGPFFGVDVAGIDRNISEYSVRCLIHGLEITAAIGGGIMVMHTGYLPQFSTGGRRHWFRNWSERMPEVLEKAEELGVMIALENTWDDRPEILEHLAGLLPGDNVRFCLDTGHVNTFSHLPLKKWWDAIGDRVVVIHLHDNDGSSDDHLLPGNGTFDFSELAGYLKTLDDIPLLDLEVDLADAAKAKEYLAGIFSRIWRR